MAVGLPVYLCNAMPAGLHPALGLRDYAALGVYAGSFLFEVIADRQKTAWRRAKDAKEHEEQFITSGLWSISRHPKYVYIHFTRRLLTVFQLCRRGWHLDGDLGVVNCIS